jgi:hypothetical protein
MHIIIISAIVSVVIASVMYFFLLSLTEPEPLVEIYTYSRNIDKGTILSELDINSKDIPKSLYSYGIESSKENIVGKKLLTGVNAGEFIYTNKLTERGRIENDFDDLYIIGIDVTNISNFLGTQLKEGDTYYLLGDKEVLAAVETDIVTKTDSVVETIISNVEVTIISLVDSTGNVVLGNKQTPIKTVNLGVKKLEDLHTVKELEKLARVDLIRYPVKEELKIESIKVDQSKVNTKTIILENGVIFYVD